MWRQSVLLCLIILVTGCAGWRETPLSQAELSALQAEPEILVIHHRLPRLEYNLSRAKCRSRCRGSLKYPEPTPILLADPTRELLTQFIVGLKTTLGLKYVRPISDLNNIEEDLNSEPSEQQQDLFDKGQPLDMSGLDKVTGEVLLFDFAPLSWELHAYEHWQQFGFSMLDRTRDSAYLYYVVQGSLVRLSESSVLWRAVCSVNVPLTIPTTTTPYELAKDPNSILNLKRQEAATRCSNELLKKVLGQWSWSDAFKNGFRAVPLVGRYLVSDSE